METPRLHPDAPNALPMGTRLGEYELRSLLGVGGFGIVYLAFDHALEREVAIKEYMPQSLAGRTETLFVSLRSHSDAETFALGLKSFVNEAKLLARFDHPSLLKVHRFWEANGTAYMAMPVMRGRTMKEVRHGLAAPPDEAWLRALLVPLLGAIERLHSEGVYHRDIAPDNIQIEPDGRPVLLDFGAARRVISDKTQTITAILKPAYAPIEQYADSAALKQGPWTDLYALGATLHYMLLGHPPAPATTRAVIEEASALTFDNCPGCSADFLGAIEWMLAPRPQDRPQSVAALREVLEGRAPLPQRKAAAPAPAEPWQRTVRQERPVPPSGAGADEDVTRVLPPPAAAPVTAAPLPLVDPLPTGVPPPPAPAPFSAPPVATLAALPPPAGPKWGLILGGAGAVAVAVGAVVLWPKSAPAPAPTPSAAASAPPVFASAPAPALVPAPQPAPMPAPESAVAAVVLPGTPAAKPPVANAPSPRPANTGSRPPASQAQKPTQAPPPAANTLAESPVPAPAPAPVQAAPVPAPAPLEPVRTQPVAAAPAPAEPSGPQAACSGKRALAYFGCMERECLRSKFKEHADCVKWRQEARRTVNE